MGQSEENYCSGTMKFTALICLLSLALAVSSQGVTHNLPVLFQYADKAHNVAVFRGAELKQAIADGLVPGFGSLGREGKKIDDSAAKAAAAARAAAEARERAAADARAAAAARAVAARPSQLELAEQACVQACKNLAGQCRNHFL